jgi:hypothetical protein
MDPAVGVGGCAQGTTGTEAAGLAIQDFQRPKLGAVVTGESQGHDPPILLGILGLMVPPPGRKMGAQKDPATTFDCLQQ